jgi:hypothetical protein
MSVHSPRVGIFYVIGVDLYIESMPMSEGEDWGDFKTYPSGHMEYWLVLTKQLNLSSCLSYDFYPRGRVSYAKVQDKYLLYIDRCLVKNRQTVRLIKRELCLLKERVELSTDEHYQCSICNPHYVPDFI